ncbi:MAG: growth inhibitor PemK [Chitinophaga sp.]|jgi:mRNA interferase MazF|nr:growth inhibitor PemK [Chitinophaga sp.]
MGKFIAGDIVIIPFPYTDLSNFKKRPALVIKALNNEDYLLAMITSKNYEQLYSFKIDQSDFIAGNLPVESWVRCNRLFEANETIIINKTATLNNNFVKKIIEELIAFLRT